MAATTHLHRSDEVGKDNTANNKYRPLTTEKKHQIRLCFYTETSSCFGQLHFTTVPPQKWHSGSPPSHLPHLWSSVTALFLSWHSQAITFSYLATKKFTTYKKKEVLDTAIENGCTGKGLRTKVINQQQHLFTVLIAHDGQLNKNRWFKATAHFLPANTSQHNHLTKTVRQNINSWEKVIFPSSNSCF